MKTSRFSVTQILGILKQAEGGLPVPELYRLAPKILDPIDVIFSIHEGFRMIDPVVLEIADVENIIPTPAIGIDDAIGHNFAGHDGHQSLTRSIRNDLCINPSTTLK